jgi:hypothetical protein
MSCGGQPVLDGVYGCRATCGLSWEKSVRIRGQLNTQSYGAPRRQTAAMQRLEPVAAGGRTNGERHQADIPSCGPHDPTNGGNALVSRPPASQSAALSFECPVLACATDRARPKGAGGSFLSE